jgi:hypothetical protein
MSEMSVPEIDPDADITTLAAGRRPVVSAALRHARGRKVQTRVGLGSAAKMRGQSDRLMRILQTA